MNTMGTRPEQMKVVFPADAPFFAVGRVAISGLALRIGIDVTAVEQLRVAVDAATSALCAQGVGQVTLDAQWQDDWFVVVLSNLDNVISDEEASELASLLQTLVDDPDVTATQVTLRLQSIG